ncbi:MAG: ABC transporter ATP-binding protein [Streptosporangiaceae bacterium]
MTPLLSLRDLSVSYGSGAPPAVRDVSLDVPAGQLLAVVGESGSGKSTTVLAVLGLLPPAARVSGTISFDGAVITGLGEPAMRQLRGRSIGLVPQDPTLSLDPTLRVGRQVAETLIIHGLATRREARARAIEVLAEAGMDDPSRRARQYPHELSGGMRQRVLIGMAWACRPRLILADEPTSALDVTIQRQVLDHLDRLRSELGTTVVLVTHDLSVAAERAQYIAVMSAGQIVEQGTPDQVLRSPAHAYTRQLVASMPSQRPVRVTSEPTVAEIDDGDLVVASHLVKEFAARRADGARFRFRAVDDVSFSIGRGETLSLVGESGSGKTTTARMIMCLERPTDGEITFDGTEVTALAAGRLRKLRERFQMVYQNPYSSLSPQFSLNAIIAEPLRAFGVGSRAERRARAAELLNAVGLPASYGGRRPHELSGGQRQRVAIARALALRPDLIVCDEPVSALDATVQAQILDLLAELQRELGLSYLFISHDLAVVKAISDRIAVMRKGQIVETGPTETVFAAPAHAYTRQLLAAVPGDTVR